MDVDEAIRALCVRVEPVGSRVTCDPAPTDTDIDYLLLSADGNVLAYIHQDGWILGGSVIADAANKVSREDRFSSFKKGNVNLIVTTSARFFERFMAATYVAHRLNLLCKTDRISLFQAVLYGNIMEC